MKCVLLVRNCRERTCMRTQTAIIGDWQLVGSVDAGVGGGEDEVDEGGIVNQDMYIICTAKTINLQWIHRTIRSCRLRDSGVQYSYSLEQCSASSLIQVS
jgi:hypothetical protein